MGFEKLLIAGRDGEIFGLKYDNIKKIVVLGGNKKFRETYEFCVGLCFKIDNIKPHQVTPNKIKYRFKTVQYKYSIAKENMEKAGFTVLPVKNHERLMR